MLTPEDIIAVRFETTRFGRGYDQDEVDDFLDRIALTLRGHTEGNAEAITLLADDIDAVTFTETRFRDGYRTEGVDALLDEATAALRAHESKA